MAFVQSAVIRDTKKQRVAADVREKYAKQARARDELQVREARKESGAFVEYVMRNEADGSRLRNAWFHREWHQTVAENDHVVLIAPVEHAKSQAISIGRVLFEIGKNPNIRIALISSTEKLAKKLLKQLRAEIERNPRLHRVFPHLRKSTRKEDPWTSTAITVQRDTISRDPTVQVLGAFGAIVGSRLELIVLDDVLSFENTRNEEQREKLVDWFDTTVYTRLVANAKVFCIGTPWHPDDLLHKLAARPAFVAKRYSAVVDPNVAPRHWQTNWPEQWPVKRLLHRRANMPEEHFIRKYLCQVRLDSTSRFRKEWLDRMCALGKGLTFELVGPPRRAPRTPQLPCFTGVDFGAGEKSASGLTVITTIALYPDGRKRIVNIASGRWQAPEILERLAEVSKIYRSEILCESNAFQRWAVQLSAGRIPNIHGRDTNARNKHDEQWGVESLAVEMRQMQWIMPSGADGKSVPDEGIALINECLHYDPEQHTGDRLMSLWLAREAARKWGNLGQGRLDTQRR